MISINFEQALKMPVKDPNWFKKTGVLFVIYVLFTIISYVLQNLSSIMELILGYDYYYDYSPMVSILLLLFFGFTFLVIIPFSIYFGAYNLEIQKNVMNGSELPLPEHKDFGYKLKLFGGAFLIGIGPFLLILALMGLCAIPFVFGLGSAIGNQEAWITIIAILFGVLAIMATIIVSIVISLILIPAMIYLFLSTGNVATAFQFDRVSAVIKYSWTSLVAVALISLALSIVGAFFAMFTWLCLMGWLTQPIVTLWTSLTTSHLQGQVFADLKAKGL